jgi:hypothetical protein
MIIILDYLSLDSAIRMLTPGLLPTIIPTKSIILMAMITQYLY